MPCAVRCKPGLRKATQQNRPPSLTPWIGTAPLRRSSLTRAMLHAGESALGETFENAPLGSQIVPLPDTGADDMASMRSEFKGRRGSTLVVEGVAQATAAGMNPQIGQRPDQLSPDLSKSMTAETLAAAREGISIADNAGTFLQTVEGKQRSAKALTGDMRKWCDAAGLPECTPHGLRKAIARRMAEAGAHPHMIGAVTGHRTLSEVQRYTEAADRERLAAGGIALLTGTKQEENMANIGGELAKNKGKVRE